MEKSRSLFRNVIGHKMLFVVFLLFPTDILVEGQNTAEPVTTANVTLHVDSIASLNASATSFPASSKMPGEISTTSVTSHTDATMPGTLSQQPALSFKASPPVSKQEVQLPTVVNTAVPVDTSSPMPSKVAVITKEKDRRTETTGEKKIKPQKEVPSKTTVTPHFVSETVSSPTKDVGTRSQGAFLDQSPSAIAYPETTKSIEPKEDKKGPIPPDQAVPELTQSPESGTHYTSGPFTTSVALTSTSATHGNPKTSSGQKKHPIIILAIVFGIVLLAGLIVFLYLRRRRHSGSTSFNSPEWAGQATLPDDTGLDKDVEQQAGSGGEGETRRGTLVTFFGKRQSRVPSIAMEDINGKGGKAEREQLLSGEAEVGSPSGAIGDANGKVPEPLKGSSQESPAS
ncbi:leukosialin isoform X1 [Thamnophis elegans]|uniref:leukosialin isoform X1 n=1 Tax=Thamnophis elegans TaxID=35005 RepID=UPI001377781F|nr:leukosialin isoform X1 [Thamnophis elegans]XP_032093511.1 leukosialin isoform X1 [Thamnophis elegans]XP_032093512.1 leukosialin isoform X1 [Thamnophis elegans]XP_032093513.1 leukosialin isoform X1 [Thamnophis elegans]